MSMLEYREGPHEQLLWSTESLRIGRFRVRVEDHDFATGGQVVSAPCLAFAQRPVTITWPGHLGVMADVDRVILHDVEMEFRREAVSRDGDRSVWLQYSPDDLNHALERHGHAGARTGRRVFRSRWAPVDDTTCLLKTALVRHLDRPDPDRLFLEETALLILDRVLGGLAERPSGGSPSRHLAEAARKVLSERWREQIQLQDIADAVGASRFHLCRIFRRHTGTTLWRHLRQIRLRRSLDRVTEDNGDLSAIAFDHGFCSHSHFTSSFRRVFGLTPSAFRVRVRASSIGELVEGLVPNPLQGRG